MIFLLRYNFLAYIFNLRGKMDRRATVRKYHMYITSVSSKTVLENLDKRAELTDNALLKFEGSSQNKRKKDLARRKTDIKLNWISSGHQQQLNEKFFPCQSSGVKRSSSSPASASASTSQVPAKNF